MALPQNPKHIQALKDSKAPLEYLVTSCFEDDAYVHKHGADKYGKFNWRVDEITASTYVGAMMRHLKAWTEGQDLDPDSGKPHLTHLRACCAVVLDAQMYSTLIDDRRVIESKSLSHPHSPAHGTECGPCEAQRSPTLDILDMPVVHERSSSYADLQGRGVSGVDQLRDR